MAEKYLTFNPAASIDEAVNRLNPDKVLVLTDSNVMREVFPKLSSSEIIGTSPVMAVPPGEEFKNPDTVVSIWSWLQEEGATRRSVLLNVGGGVVTDMGGFAAATFKRGIRTINFPTTLLGAVDAATGGKTGIDFGGMKNEIGAFHMPSDVIVSPLPFSTLPFEEKLSGYAEMVKTALISDAGFYKSLYNIEDVLSDPEKLGKGVAKCVSFKEEVVAQDPKENGLRKILNFGHTAGHALESLRIEKGNPVSHGKAVAHGMAVALILSHMKLGFPSSEVSFYKNFLRENFGGPLIGCREVPEVIARMNGDKKNRVYGQPLFILLKEIGEPEIDVAPTQRELRESLEVYLSL